MKYLLVALLIGGLSTLQAVSEAKMHEKNFVTSVPKSGTHLLVECIHLITGKTHKVCGEPWTRLDRINLENFPRHKFLFSHATYTPKNVSRLQASNFKGFFILRDPRDNIVSMAYWVHKLAHKEQWKKYQKLSIDQLIHFLIPNYSLFHDYDPHFIEPKSIDYIYRNLYMPWISDPMVYTTYFESLVGPKGGGKRDVQLKEIKNIAQHLGVSLTPARTRAIADAIFGVPNVTFREGKIGSWKQHFTTAHKEAFKKVAGQLLIDLGYEKDLNW